MKQRLHYGWVMVFCAMGIFAVNSQPFYSFGIFLGKITGELGWERGAMSAALSITMLVGNPLSLFAGRLSDKYGPRLLLTIAGVINFAGFLMMSQMSALWQFYLLFGVMIAAGNSLCFIPLSSTIPRWFNRKRGLALGLIYAGMTVGGIIGPILVQSIINLSSWRWAYAVLGIMSLTVFVTLAQFLKRSPEAAGIKPYGDDDVSGNNNSVIAPANEFNLKQALASSQFWLFGAGLVCLYFIGQTVLSQIAPHVVDIGLSRNLSAVILSVYAATSLAGTLLSGILTERIGIKKTIMVGFGIIFVMLVWLLFSNKEWMFYVFAVVFGTGFGIMIPLQTAAPGELFGLKSLGTISAALNVIGALGGATGPPLAGAIFDARGSYQLAFIIAIGMGCVAIILAFILNKVTVQKVRGN